MRRRLMLLISAVVVPLAAAGIYNESRVRHERVEEVHADALRTARLVHADIANLIQGTRNLLIAISTLPLVQQPDASRCAEGLTELRARFDRYVSIVLTDWDGMIVCSSGAPMPPGLIKDRPYITEARKTADFVVGGFTRTRGTQLPVLPLSYPLRGPDGQGKGILVATLDLNWLSQHLAEIPGAENGVVSIADRDGLFLARTAEPARYLGRPVAPGALPLVTAKAPGTAEVTSSDGIARIIGYVPSTMAPAGVFVTVGIDRALAMGPVNFETAIESLCIFAAMALALFAGWIGAGRFARLQAGMLARTAELEAEREHRAQVEAVLAQSQKLEAVGQLTAGLAHDFNNLLAVVIGNIELARGRLRADPASDRMLERAITAAERGSGLTRQLLAFARNQRLAIEPADPNQLIEGVGDLLERSAGAAIRIRRELAPDVAPVLVDRGQLEVALLNLVLNARDAMPLGGTIVISTRTAGPDNLPPDLAPGDYVEIRVRDTGTGMTPEVKARAFEPFYTTKEVGKGSGLGLAQVFGIARQSGGTVSLESTPGIGTTVAIYLPRSAASAAAARPVAEGRPGAASARLGRLRVLLVDDDPDVRATLATVMRSLDLTVVEFDSGAAALEYLAGDAAFDVLITDIVMPEMSGTVLAERAAALVPGIKLLLITGFAPVREAADLPWPVLKKPFKAADIEAALRDLTRSGNVVSLAARRDGPGLGGASL